MIWFKIDFIVWKLKPINLSVKYGLSFKIDFIVWKLFIDEPDIQREKGLK